MDWTGGYVTQEPYVIRFHRALNPRRMGLALLTNGYDALSCDQPYTYMELGFGQGVTLVMLAAANPHAQFYGVDFLSEHVAHAQSLADAAGLQNIHLRQISFSELHQHPWPAFDFIAMHGVWTWVTANFRSDILRFVNAQLKPGGVAYVSYNAMPGWAVMEPVRELLKLEYDRASGSLEERIRTALKKVRDIEKAQPLFFKQNPTVDLRLKQMESEKPAYLAHEYFNAEWKPFYFEDVSADFANIGLSFAASANLQDNVLDIAVRAEAKALYADMATTLQRETLKDLLANKQFRRDIYVRGPRVLSDAEMSARFSEARFAAQMAVAALADAKLTTEGMFLKLNAPIHQALVKALSQAPHTISDVCADPAVAHLTANDAYATLFLLAAMNAVEAAAPEHIANRAVETCQKLNAIIVQRAGTGAGIPALVSPVIGAGVDVSAEDQVFIQKISAEKPVPLNARRLVQKMLGLLR